jgi:hypothetical protein
VKLSRVERELLARLPGPNDSTGTFRELLEADLFPPNCGFDRKAAVQRAIDRIDAAFSPLYGRRGFIERVHGARDPIGDDRKPQSTKGYRLTVAAYRWVRLNIEAREAARG